MSFASKTLAAAGSDPMQICDRVAEEAARARGVPVAVLKALTRTETGVKKNGKFGPWAWTVNMEGKGVWFDTLDAARAYVFAHFKRGARSFDVGCFQINYKWHHQEFASIDEMFEPRQNADYAADFLLRLKAELGSWEKAVGAYHSRTPKHAKRYTQAYRKHLAQVETLAPMGQEHGSAQSLTTRRRNTYPLLQSGGAARALGSLVALTPSARGGLLSPERALSERLP